jgi:hypothetical protein
MPHPVMVPKPRARMITRERSTGEGEYLWVMVNSQVLGKRRALQRPARGKEE